MACCCLLSFSAMILLLTSLFLWFTKKDPSKINGVYSRPGKFYWIKVVFIFLMMKFRKWKDSRNKEKVRDGTNAGYGVKSASSPEEMDKIQKLSDHMLAIDAIYFNGANKDGYCIITGTARRSHNVINGFIIFTIPNVGTFVSPKFPDSMLFDASSEFYGAEGFKYLPKVPMKHWELNYEGDLKKYGEENEDKKYKARLTAQWKSDLPYFDYDTMIPTWTMARAIGKEKWSREYFNALKEAHQTHYEQHGVIEGKIEIDGKEYKFSMNSMRDHSYGVKRNWKLLYRYIFHMFSLEDGSRFDIGNVCQPCTSSELELGYVYEKDGSLHAIKNLDMPLWLLGENGVPPIDYGFTCKTTNGKEYYVQVQVLETQEFYIGFDWEAKIIERRCKFTVDGIEGYGVSECMYRNAEGRPENYSKNDPEWVKKTKVI